MDWGVSALDRMSVSSYSNVKNPAQAELGRGTLMDLNAFYCVLTTGFTLAVSVGTVGCARKKS